MQTGEGTYRNKKMLDKLVRTSDFRESRNTLLENELETTVSDEQNKANNTTVSESETSEKPIGQAQISPEAFRTFSGYTNMVRGQCNKKLHRTLR